MDDITIDPEPEIGEGVYSLFSVLAQDSVSITAKGLLEVAAWVEQNKAALEKQLQPRNGIEDEID